MLRELSIREIRTTFTGSMLGVSWLVLQPLLTLTVYAATRLRRTASAGAPESMLFLGHARTPSAFRSGGKTGLKTFSIHLLSAIRGERPCNFIPLKNRESCQP